MSDDAAPAWLWTGRRVRPRVGGDASSRRRFGVSVAIVWGVLLLLTILGFALMGLDFGLIWRRLPFLLGVRLSPSGFVQGAALTLLITAISMACACTLALLTALGRLSHHPVAFATATFYASFFRGTPLLVQVLLIYLALPQVGIVLGAMTSGVMALSLNYGAYLAETVRGGILSVPAGQREAAQALGLPPRVVAVRIVMPQALRVIIPPAGTQFVSMLKDSSLVSIMGLWELNFLAQSYGRTTYHYLEMLITAAAIYWFMSVGLEIVQARLERHYGRGHALPGRPI